MKLTLFSVLNLVVVVLAVKQPQKSVIVSYPNDTPDSVVQQAMGAIKDAGGMITHEYKLIKCIGLIIFAAWLTYSQRICGKGTSEDSRNCSNLGK